MSAEAAAAAKQQQAGRQAGRREKGGETDSRPAAARARSRGGIYAPGNKGHIVPDGVRVCLSAACESEGTSGEGGRGRRARQPSFWGWVGLHAV